MAHLHLALQGGKHYVFTLKSLIPEVIILAPYYHAYIEFSKQNPKNQTPINAKQTLFIWFLRLT